MEIRIVIMIMLVFNIYSSYALSTINQKICNSYQSLDQKNNCIKELNEEEAKQNEKEIQENENSRLALEREKIKSLPPKENALKNINLESSLTRSEFNTISGDFMISNKSKYIIKDIEITCNSYANSGTLIDKNIRVIYEIISYNDSKKIKDFDMGFINSQSEKFQCFVSDLIVTW
jgi:hypothetical protein